jgi:hypothetical protein
MLVLNIFYSILIFIILFNFNFNFEEINLILNNNNLSIINYKLFAHNFIKNYFKKSIITNVLFYFIIFSFEIIYLYYNKSLSLYYLNKLPIYVSFLVLIDFFIINFDINILNLIKSNLTFFIVELIFGHNFTIYEIISLSFISLLSLLIDNISKYFQKKTK